jgi:hypothetical protein
MRPGLELEDAQAIGMTAAGPIAPGTCTWCGSLFNPRKTGGRAQRFCSARCRMRFHTACRLWGEKQVRRGLVPVATLHRLLAQRVR